MSVCTPVMLMSMCWCIMAALTTATARLAHRASRHLRARARSCVRAGTEVYHTLKSKIVERYGSLSASVGDEGGFAPDLADVEEALGLITEAVADSGHQGLVYIGLDVAASEISVCDSDDKDTLAYRYTLRPGQPPLSSAELVAIYEVLRCCHTAAGLRRSAKLDDVRVLFASSVLFDVESVIPVWRAATCQDLCARFPIASIEDPFDQNDLEGWAALTKRIGSRVQVSASQAAMRIPAASQPSPVQASPACWLSGTAHGFAPLADTNNLRHVRIQTRARAQYVRTHKPLQARYEGQQARKGGSRERVAGRGAYQRRVPAARAIGAYQRRFRGHGAWLHRAP